MLPIKTLISAAALLVSGVQSLDLSANNNVALYWGQNGYGNQGSLASYCQETDLDIVNVAFLNDFPDPLNLNLANACGTTFDSGLLHCPPVAEDIKTCQSLGKTVLLSLGGAYGNYGFADAANATAFATTLWNKFGGGSDPERPFDDAVVDGFDFDIENGNSVGYVDLANELRTLFAQDTSKTYYLSAAPQCPFPDSGVNDLLAKADLDFAFIQFYNNPCGLDGDFNFDTWSTFAQSAANSNLKLFVGLPAAQSAANYVDPATIKSVLEDIKCDPTFAGISLWDASAAWANVDAAGDNFVVQVKDVLDELVCPAPSSSSVTTSAAETTPVAESSVIESSSLFYGNASSAAAGEVTVTDIHTTVVTITSCVEDKCHATAITTGYVVVTDLTTSYTTYCPLSGETEAAPATSKAAVVPGTTEAAAPYPTTSTVVVAPVTTSAAAGFNASIIATGPVSAAPAVSAAPVVPAEDETSILTIEITSTIGGPAGNASVPVVAPLEGAASSISLVWYMAVPLVIAGLL
ncbi:putative endochitinase [Scheffersomyces xylosifermentans]|uniref:putative endochitinase n=1 Tax=Scheffersomyces xylosifermentans TaxID=1304137 RepID=UPI00315CDF62